MFDPKSFRTSSLDLAHLIWGVGHTLETDPTRKGWRCREVKPSHVPGHFLVGRPGQEGCASIHRIRDVWHVGIYLMSPAEAHKLIKEIGGFLDAHWVEVNDIPGFGLDIIREIEAEVLRYARITRGNLST